MGFNGIPAVIGMLIGARNPVSIAGLEVLVLAFALSWLVVVIAATAWVVADSGRRRLPRWWALLTLFFWPVGFVGYLVVSGLSAPGHEA